MIYKVAYGNSLNALESQVNRLIGEGWSPQGGIHTNGPFYAQAMVRVEYQ